MGYKKTSQFLLMSLILLVGAGCLGSLTLDAFQQGHWWKMFGLGLLSITFLLMGLLTWDIMRLQPSDSHNLQGLLLQYAMIKPFAYYGKYKLAQLPFQGTNKRKLQSDYLMELLRRNQNTAYGKDHKFSEIKSPEDFINMHPLTSYSHYENYVKRVVDDGEPNVMFKDKPMYVAITSGTTGKNKRFPLNKHLMNLNFVGLLCQYLATRSNMGLLRILGLRFKPKVLKSKTGVIIAPISYASREYYHFISPKEAFEINSEKEALYLHALFGLAEEDVALIDSLLAFLMYSFFKVIEDNHEQLCNDLERGQISDNLDIPADIRATLSKKMIPNPARAAFLRQEFAKGFCNIAVRVWPKLKAVSMITSGTFAAHTKLLQDCHLGPDVELISGFHGASEGTVGVCVSTDLPTGTYVVLPFMAYFEFIEEGSVHEENPKTYLLDQVKTGNSYEVVMTNEFGLYRYRLGDVIKFTGLYANCPVYEYQYRLGQLLNVAWEKMPESVFYKALQSTMMSWAGVELRDYTAVENTLYEKLQSGLPGYSKYYVLFVELSKDGDAYVLDDTDKEKFDQNLCSEFELYNNLRQNGTIDEMHVIQIQNGGFMRLKFHMIRESGNQQFKMPRVLRNEEHLSFLLQETLQGKEKRGIRTSGLPSVEHTEEFVHVEASTEGFNLKLNLNQLNKC